AASQDVTRTGSGAGADVEEARRPGAAASPAVASIVGPARADVPGTVSSSVPVASAPRFEPVSFPAALTPPPSAWSLERPAAPSLGRGSVVPEAPGRRASLTRPGFDFRGLEEKPVAQDRAPARVILDVAGDVHRRRHLEPVPTSPVSQHFVTTLWDDALQD